MQHNTWYKLLQKNVIINMTTQTLQRRLCIFIGFLQASHEEHILFSLQKKQTQITKTCIKIINFTVNCAVIYGTKSADDSPIESSVKVKANNPKDINRNPVWVNFLHSFVHTLSLAGSSVELRLFNCKYEYGRISAVLRQSKLVVSKENPIIADESKGSIFSKESITLLVAFCIGKVLFNCILKRKSVESASSQVHVLNKISTTDKHVSEHLILSFLSRNQAK